MRDLPSPATRREGIRRDRTVVAERVWRVLANAAAAHWDILRQDLRYTARTLAAQSRLRVHGDRDRGRRRRREHRGVLRDRFRARAAAAVSGQRPAGPRLAARAPAATGGWSSRRANYRDWYRLSTSFERAGAFYSWEANLVGRGEPERVDLAVVTADLLPTLGVRPAIGRFFEHRRRAWKARPATLILSDALWKREFGADTGVLGTHVTAGRRGLHDRRGDAGQLQLPHERRAAVDPDAPAGAGVRGSQRQPARGRRQAEARRDDRRRQRRDDARRLAAPPAVSERERTH